MAMAVARNNAPHGPTIVRAFAEQISVGARNDRVDQCRVTLGGDCTHDGGTVAVMLRVDLGISCVEVGVVGRPLECGPLLRRNKRAHSMLTPGVEVRDVVLCAPTPVFSA